MCVSGWRVIWEALYPRKDTNDERERKKKEKEKKHNLVIIPEKSRRLRQVYETVIA